MFIPYQLQIIDKIKPKRSYEMVNQCEKLAITFFLPSIKISLGRITFKVNFCSQTVYYSIGFTKSTSRFWQQINKSVGGSLLI